MEDRRIPYDLMQTPDAERYFLFHRQDLEAKQRQVELKEMFREALVNSSEVSKVFNYQLRAIVIEGDMLKADVAGDVSAKACAFSALLPKTTCAELTFDKSNCFSTSVRIVLFKTITICYNWALHVIV